MVWIWEAINVQFSFHIDSLAISEIQTFPTKFMATTSLDADTLHFLLDKLFCLITWIPGQMLVALLILHLGCLQGIPVALTKIICNYFLS